MRVAPPVLPGSTNVAESPIDRAIALAIADENAAALRWAAAIVKQDPSMPTALLLCGRLLGELGRQEIAREACLTAIARAIDLENLPLAVVAVRELSRFGGAAEGQLDLIAEAFCKGSPRLGDGAPPPPPLPTLDSFQPLASVLTGALLLNKASEIIHDAKHKLDREVAHPGIASQPLFSSIGRDGLRGLCAAMTPLWVAQGDVVIQQGAVGLAAFFVARGELEVRRQRERSEPMVLARLTNGNIFGEMALLSRAPRAGSVVATRPSIVLEVKRDAFDALAEAQPDVGTELAAHCKMRMVQNLVRMSHVLIAVPAADRPALINRFQMRSYEKNERIVVQDEPPPGLFLIASGQVAIVRRDMGGGDPLVIAQLGTGDVIGEVAMVLRRKANADVIAVHPSVMLFLRHEDFMGLIGEHPQILVELYRIAVQRDEETSNIIDEEASVAEDFVLV